MADVLEPGQLFLFDRPAQGTPVLSSEIRDNLQAVARTNLSSDPAFPANPRTGMLRFLTEDPLNYKLQAWLEQSGGGAAWRDLLQYVNLGIAAPAKLVFDITVPPLVNSWTIDHNLGSYPLVQPFNSAGYQFGVLGQGFVPAANQCLIQQVTLNRVVITFAPATFPTGFVVIVG
jgi:hypothetical protein